MLGQNTTHHILININSKGIGYLLGDADTAETGDSGVSSRQEMDNFLGRSLWTWLTVTAR